MVEFVVVGIGLLIVAGLAAIGAAASQYAATGERPVLPLAGVAIALAGVFALGQAGGYFRPLRAATMTALALVAAAWLAAQWYRAR